jgi:hypothetical protein
MMLLSASMRCTLLFQRSASVFQCLGRLNVLSSALQVLCTNMMSTRRIIYEQQAVNGS